MKRQIPYFQSIIAFLLLFSGGISIGQNQKLFSVKADPRLYDCFEKSYVDGLQANPNLLLYYNFFLDNSYFISDVPDKSVDLIDISSLALRNPGPKGEKLYFNEDFSQIKTGTFNPLLYEVTLQPMLFTNYRLGKSGKVLVFYSNKVFTEKYNNYLKSFTADLEK